MDSFVRIHDRGRDILRALHADRRVGDRRPQDATRPTGHVTGVPQSIALRPTTTPRSRGVEWPVGYRSCCEDQLDYQAARGNLNPPTG